MTDKIRSTTRSLTEEMLKLNKQMIDWNLDANKRVEKQVASAFDASRNSLSALQDMQSASLHAWLDFIAPEAA